MSDKTESPALLSPEQVQNAATYAEWLKGKEGFFADYGPLPDEMIKTSASLLSALLADRAAFRQKVATELASLLEEPTEHKDTSYDEESYWVAIDLMQEKARAAATRLGLDLSAPTF